MASANLSANVSKRLLVCSFNILRHSVLMAGRSGNRPSAWPRACLHRGRAASSNHSALPSSRVYDPANVLKLNYYFA